MAAILPIKANFILVGFISKNHGRHHSSCHLYWFCFTTLHFNYDYLHCSAKERVSKYPPLVVEAFLSIRLIEEEHHALEWLKSLLFLFCFLSQWYPLPKHALFHPHYSDVFVTSIKASIFLSKFSCISRAFSLAVLVNSFYHNMALRFPPIL